MVHAVRRPSIARKGRSMKDQVSVSIREILAGNVQLASPPEIFLKINKILDDPNGSLGQVTILIEHDAGLTARLLKIVNSALYHFPSPVASIRDAIKVIGYQELRDLVLATLVVDRFSSLPNGLISMRNFWMMSVRCALIAKLLAEHHPEHHRLGTAFVCGLLHEIGRLIVYQRLPEPARAAVLLATRDNVPEYLAQRRVIGFDHYAVGAELARRWRLPQVIVATLDYHETPEHAGEFALETALVSIAYQLYVMDFRDPAWLDKQLSDHAAAWQIVGLERDLLDEVLPKAENEFLEVFNQVFQER